MAGKWQSHFEWNGPDWKNINGPDTSAVGFNKGKALSAHRLDGRGHVHHASWPAA